MARFLFLVSFIFFSYILLLYMVGSYNLGFFDGPLRMLPHYYTANNLTPYKDFGVVYPPGMFVFIGKVVPFLSMTQRNFVLGLLVYSLICYLFKLILHFFNSPNTFYLLSVSLLAHSILITLFGPGEFIAIELILAILVLSTIYLSFSSTHFPHLVPLFFFLLTWLRWDWPIFLLAILGMSSFLSRKYTFFVSIFAGYLFGLLSLLLYLARLDVLRKAFDFIVWIPFMVLPPYRFHPFENPNSWVETFPILVLMFGLFFVAICLKRLFSVQFSRIVFLLGTPLMLVPYALGRTDWPHSIPVWFILTHSWLIYHLLYPNRVLRGISIVFALIPLFRFAYIKDPEGLKLITNNALTQINQEISNCKSLAIGKNVNSVFVGHTSYRRFLYNYASLYFTFPQVPPATAFISDEPGLQNSCDYGMQIASQLANSPKPMVAFLETKDHPTERNLTASMTSCGMIEDYLDSAPYEDLGKCQAYGSEMSVRLYTD